MRPVIGLCRFSFVGRGDWVAWRGHDGDDALRAETASMLYDEARLTRRFWTFENLLLASLKAQTCPDWHLIVLTSDVMPQRWLDRLRDICASDPRITVEISSLNDVNTAMLPTVAEVEKTIGNTDGRTVQFRIDDDDCLSNVYVERLQAVTATFSEFKAFSFTMPKGLVATFYDDQPPQAYELELPFHSVGTAALLPPRRAGDSTIFSFGHFGIGKRWHAVADYGPPGFFAVKMTDHDSAQITADGGGKHAAISWDALEARLATNFPFIDLPGLRKALAAG